jgi:hypothetical protein
MEALHLLLDVYAAIVQIHGRKLFFGSLWNKVTDSR